MTRKASWRGTCDQLLGEIEARIVGIQHHEGTITPGEQMHLEREPRNPHDSHAIRVENGHCQPVGHLPRGMAAWLAPLIDEGKVRVDGLVPKSALPSDNTFPVSLTIYLCEKGRHLLRRTDAHSQADILHEVIRKAYQDAQRYADPKRILDLAEGLKPLTRQDLLPESRLLMALLPGLAQEAHTAQAFQAMATMHDRLRHVIVGEPIHYHNLTLFPLAWPEPQQAPYTLLALAIEQGEAVVKEVDEAGQVGNLRVVNRSDRPLLIPEGEILVGAKQNRVVNVTVLVAAKSTFTVPVSCVEQGRWQYRSGQFRSEYCAPPSLRGKRMRAVHRTRATSGMAHGDQGEVWQDVAACLSSVGADSKTSSLTDGFEAAQERLQEYRNRLKLPEDAAGVLIARGDRVIGMDLFDASETLAALWPRLSDAYFFDALRYDSQQKQAEKSLAGRFVRQTAATAKPRARALGLGSELEITGDGIVGAALLYSGCLCHVSAFGEELCP